MWRRSWAYKNIYGSNGNGNASKRRLMPDERSVWDDYLDMATLSPIHGQVCISKDIGYTALQLSSILKTPVEVIERANRRMQEFGMITVENTGIIVIDNWKNYQSEYERQKSYREKLQPAVTKEGYKEIRVDIDKRYIRKEYKSIYTSILNYWNSKKVIVHKYLKTYALGRINAKLDHGFTEADIKTAIDNYAYILKSKKYFWTKEWELGEFLQRGFDKFFDLEGAKNRYKDTRGEDDAVTKLKSKFRRNK